jgi:hypothetical protein
MAMKLKVFAADMAERWRESADGSKRFGRRFLFVAGKSFNASQAGHL